MNRRWMAQLGVLIGGCALGILAAYFAARLIQLRLGRAELRSYAARMVRVGEQLGNEDTLAIEAVVHDNLPFCSDEELAFMRDYVFRAPHIRDLGRTRDGKLFCSTGIGRLRVPKPTIVPDIDTGNLKIYLRVPLMISNKTMGQVVEKDGVSIVFNFDFFKSLNEPPMFYSGLLFDSQKHRMLPGSGPHIPLNVDEILAGRLIERDGILYQPQCSQGSMNCAVAGESRSDLFARGQVFVVGFLIGGALLGATLAIILIQFYQRQRSMESQLRRAIRQGSLTLAYQPIVDLQTNVIIGAEALIRWINEDGEFVRPDIFIALAEERGFVGEITRLVTRRAADELHTLLAAGDFRVTLNLASQDLTDRKFFECLEECLAAARVPASSVGLELTERSTADHELAVEAVERLQARGHAVYIDDFGTGYSSLAYLHRLHVDAIKIDRSFTQTVGTEAVTASVVPQILAMARQLDLLIVVEGIEKEEQAEYFRRAGSRILGQGWLFGKPLPAPQFHKFLSSRRPVPPAA